MKRIIRPPAPALTAAALLAAALLLSLATGLSFLRMRRIEPVYPSPALSEHKRLSDYFQGLRGTAGDTDVYVFNGAASGGTLLVLGGAHANEPGGYITAVVLAENIAPVRGRVVVVPRANASAFSHSDPQEASPQRFALETSGGRRWFRYGSRLTNPVSQWPDPALYVNPAGQMLSGPEVRNLNRCYPGRRHGLLTEKIAFGLMELIRGEGVDIGLDIHESAPEYPVINALVFHEKSAELAALAKLEFEAAGFDIRLEASPAALRGLSHREWGDHAGIHAVLLETPNASHGRLKGRPSPGLIVEGRDKFYARAARLGRLFVPFDERGIPLDLRVARHLAAVQAVVSSFNLLTPEKEIIIENIPPADEVLARGVGAFLNPPR